MSHTTFADRAGRTPKKEIMDEIGRIIEVLERIEALMFRNAPQRQSVMNFAGSSALSSVTVQNSVSVYPAGVFDVNLTNNPVAVSQSGTWNVNSTQSGAWAVSPKFGLDSLTVKYAAINRSSSGDGTAIVSAVSNKKITVLSVMLIAASAVDVIWRSGSTDLMGIASFAASGGYALSSELGLFQTGTSEPLYLNLSAAVQVSGHISYVEL